MTDEVVPDRVRMDYIFSRLQAIAAITMIGVGIGLLTTAGVGYIAIGIGYVILYRRSAS